MEQRQVTEVLSGVVFACTALGFAYRSGRSGPPKLTVFLLSCFFGLISLRMLVAFLLTLFSVWVPTTVLSIVRGVVWIVSSVVRAVANCLWWICYGWMRRTKPEAAASPGWAAAPAPSTAQVPHATAFVSPGAPASVSYPPGWVPAGNAPMAMPTAMPPLQASRLSQVLTASSVVCSAMMVIFALPSGPMGTITAAMQMYEQAGRKLLSTRVLSLIGASGMGLLAFQLRKVSRLENTIALLMLELDYEKQRTTQAMSTAAASAAGDRAAQATATSSPSPSAPTSDKASIEIRTPEEKPTATRATAEEGATVEEPSTMPPAKEKAAAKKRAKGGRGT